MYPYSLSKKNKLQPKQRFFNFLVISDKNKIFIHKRSGKDIWKNLYDFPMIETIKECNKTCLLKNKQWNTIFKNAVISIADNPVTITHKLSHQVLHSKFFKVHLGSTNKFLEKNYIKIKLNDIRKYPVPRLIENYILQYFGKILYTTAYH